MSVLARPERNQEKREQLTVPPARSVWAAATRDVEQAASRLVECAARNEAQARTIATLTTALADAAESSDLSQLITVLGRTETLADLRREDPLAAARLRGIRAKQMLLEAEGGTVSGQEFADLVNISRQAVDKRRKNGQLIGLLLGKKGYAYPVWQANLAGLPKVLEALSDFAPMAQFVFMLNGNSWLGGETPLEALRRGFVDEVATAASMYGEQSASYNLLEKRL